MPDILERLEKFSVYSAGEQSEILAYAQSEIRNSRYTLELMAREVEHLEAIIGEKEETTDDSITDNHTLPHPTTVLDGGPHESVGTVEAATNINTGGDVVRDMSPEEIARVFGAEQVIEEPTVEEVEDLQPLMDGTKLGQTEEAHGASESSEEILYRGPTRD